MTNPSPLCPGHPTHHPGLGICILNWRQGWGAHWLSAALLGPAWSHTPHTLLTPSSTPPTLSWEPRLTVTHSPSFCQLGLVPRSGAEGPGSSCLLGKLRLPRALGRQGSFPRALDPTPTATGAWGL